MTVDDAQYLDRFLRDVDLSMHGRPGSIAEDRWLVNNYDPEKLKLLRPYLEFEDNGVTAEVVTLLGDVRERAVMTEISKMRGSRGDKVGMACLGYLTAMREDDEAIPVLLDVMDHDHGPEFFRAARRMAAIARAEDLPHVRRIYGQVGGSMRDEVRVVIERIIARNPELVPKKDLILSTPVYPNEAEFERFLDSSIEYLDVRYRANVFPHKDIKFSTYNNVARALSKMRTRLYNEADNLQFYGVDKEDRFGELSKLLKWASEDLSRKNVLDPERKGRSRTCPRCGNLLVCYKGIWMCPDCGGDLRDPERTCRINGICRPLNTGRGLGHSRRSGNLHSHGSGRIIGIP